MLEHKMASQTTDEKAGGEHPHPAVVWAQRKDKVYLTIRLDSCSKPEIELKENTLYFKGAGGPKQIVHEATLELFSSIIPEESKSTVGGREIIFMLKKKDQEAPFWPHLLKERKVHYVKTDFDKWRDEDDSDVDDNDDMNLEQMMSSMGGLGGADMAGMGGPAENEDDEDSDDEDLPDLQ